MNTLATLLLVLAGVCMVAMQVFHTNDFVFWCCAGLTLVFGALGGGLVAFGAWKRRDDAPPR
ncbi:MAG: hypothetical protein U0326_43745 [Polyangiales bacterium]